MIERGAEVSYANCGSPYYVGGAKSPAIAFQARGRGAGPLVRVGACAAYASNLHFESSRRKGDPGEGFSGPASPPMRTPPRT
ncbi:hypothetical protein RERY_02570 [Rhodococcus erythropolis]|nr:hypothetical protein RERY_02570 [Rhodococcus erythropolis]